MGTILICCVTFIITLIVFLLSIKFKLLQEIPMYLKKILLVFSIVPAWGFVIAISGIIFIIIDARKNFK